MKDPALAKLICELIDLPASIHETERRLTSIEQLLTVIGGEIAKLGKQQPPASPPPTFTWNPTPDSPRPTRKKRRSRTRKQPFR